MRSTKSSVSSNAVILLVDDNRQGLAARRVVLQEIGYQTVGVHNPREALELLRNGEYDLLVTDYKMPEIRGDEFIRQVRLEKPDIPVVLLSGFVDALGLNEKTTGANAVIMKSGNEVAHLVRAVKHLLTAKAKAAARKKPPASASSSGSGAAAEAKPVAAQKRSRAAS